MNKPELTLISGEGFGSDSCLVLDFLERRTLTQSYRTFSGIVPAQPRSAMKRIPPRYRCRAPESIKSTLLRLLNSFSQRLRRSNLKVWKRKWLIRWSYCKWLIFRFEVVQFFTQYNTDTSVERGELWFICSFLKNLISQIVLARIHTAYQLHNKVHCLWRVNIDCKKILR